MAKKITLDTIEAVLKEVDIASRNKRRVISDINNPEVRQIIKDESDHAIKHGIVGLGIAAGLSGVVTIGAVTATSSIAAGIGGSAVAVGSGIIAGSSIASGSTIMGLVGGGAAAGSSFPIIGTAIGAATGLIGGLLFGSRRKKKQMQKKQMLYQMAIGKQNSQIKALKNEVLSLQEKQEKSNREIEHLKYLLGVLSTHEDVITLLAA